MTHYKLQTYDMMERCFRESYTLIEHPRRPSHCRIQRRKFHSGTVQRCLHTRYTVRCHDKKSRWLPSLLGQSSDKLCHLKGLRIHNIHSYKHDQCTYHVHFKVDWIMCALMPAQSTFWRVYLHASATYLHQRWTLALYIITIVVNIKVSTIIILGCYNSLVKVCFQILYNTRGEDMLSFFQPSLLSIRY